MSRQMGTNFPSLVRFHLCFKEKKINKWVTDARFKDVVIFICRAGLDFVTPQNRSSMLRARRGKKNTSASKVASAGRTSEGLG